jgi:hypothetical protein
MNQAKEASVVVKKLAVEACDKEKPDTFEKVFEVGEGTGNDPLAMGALHH